MPDFLPAREVDLLGFARNFSQRIAADPGAFSVTPQQAAELVAATDGFALALRTASEPATNSTGARAVKRDAKKILKQEIRRVAGIVRAARLSEAQLLLIGLGGRDRTLTSSRKPASAPILQLGPCINGVVAVRLMDRDSPRRGRPRGTDGAMVFTWYGETPPRDIVAWGPGKLIGPPKLSITVPADTPPGTRLWVTACWLGRRYQRGPGALPISVMVLPVPIARFAGLRLAA